MLLIMPQNTVGSFYEKTDCFIGPFFIIRKYFIRKDVEFLMITYAVMIICMMM